MKKCKTVKASQKAKHVLKIEVRQIWRPQMLLYSLKKVGNEIC